MFKTKPLSLTTERSPRAVSGVRQSSSEFVRARGSSAKPRSSRVLLCQESRAGSETAEPACRQVYERVCRRVDSLGDLANQ